LKLSRWKRHRESAGSLSVRARLRKRNEITVHFTRDLAVAIGK
jgi:hypothetical protein